MYRQSEKNFLNSNTSSTCPDNMMNFGLLTAEVCWRVWGTPANYNGFHVLAALLHGTLAVGVSQTAALNRGCHLYSAGWPSRWALAHISRYKQKTHFTYALQQQQQQYYEHGMDDTVVDIKPLRFNLQRNSIEHTLTKQCRQNSKYQSTAK